MHRIQQFLNLLAALMIGGAFCATAAVYTEEDYSRTGQVIAAIAVLGSLVLVAILRKGKGKEYGFGAGSFHDLVWLAAVAGFSLLPILRGANFVDHADQYETAAYALSVIVTVYIFIFHVQFCGVKYLLGGFAAASLIGPLGYLWLARGQFNEIATVEKRFAVGGMHPNLLGFCCLGFVCISCGAILLLRSKWKWLFLVSALTGLASIYLASSRGSIVGGVGAFVTGCVIVYFRNARQALAGDSGAQRRLLLISFAGCFSLVLGIAEFHRFADSRIGTALSDRLELFSSYRGIDTGLTGRLDQWAWVYQHFTGTDFWLGIGPRKSGDLVGSIDNGYLVLALENGLVVALLIMFRLLASLAYFVNAAIRSRDPLEFRLALALACTAVAFLTNNIVARYLWGIGNPFCLFGVALFAVGPSLLNKGVREIRNALTSTMPSNPSPASSPASLSGTIRRPTR